jgi:hypothetical protein
LAADEVARIDVLPQPRSQLGEVDVEARAQVG